MRILFQLLSIIQSEEEEELQRASVSDETEGGGVGRGNEAIQLERRGPGCGSPRRSESDAADKSASWPLMGFLFWS